MDNNEEDDDKNEKCDESEDHDVEKNESRIKRGKAKSRRRKTKKPPDRQKEEGEQKFAAAGSSQTVSRQMTSRPLPTGCPELRKRAFDGRLSKGRLDEGRSIAGSSFDGRSLKIRLYEVRSVDGLLFQGCSNEDRSVVRRSLAGISLEGLSVVVNGGSFEECLVDRRSLHAVIFEERLVDGRSLDAVIFEEYLVDRRSLHADLFGECVVDRRSLDAVIFEEYLVDRRSLHAVIFEECVVDRRSLHADLFGECVVDSRSLDASLFGDRLVDGRSLDAGSLGDCLIDQRFVEGVHDCRYSSVTSSTKEGKTNATSSSVTSSLEEQPLSSAPRSALTDESSSVDHMQRSVSSGHTDSTVRPKSILLASETLRNMMRNGRGLLPENGRFLHVKECEVASKGNPGPVSAHSTDKSDKSQGYGEKNCERGEMDASYNFRRLCQEDLFGNREDRTASPNCADSSHVSSGHNKTGEQQGATLGLSVQCEDDLQYGAAGHLNDASEFSSSGRADGENCSSSSEGGVFPPQVKKATIQLNQVTLVTQCEEDLLQPEHVWQLRQENRRLRQWFLCSMCNRFPWSVALIPCGHMLCTVCYSGQLVCPICLSHVHLTSHVRLSD